MRLVVFPLIIISASIYHSNSYPYTKYEKDLLKVNTPRNIFKDKYKPKNEIIKAHQNSKDILNKIITVPPKTRINEILGNAVDYNVAQVPNEKVNIKTRNKRRTMKFRAKDSSDRSETATSSLSSSSSSLGDSYWKDEWNEHWAMKKYEALNSTLQIGDNVNMIAARPWGVPCGDPNQHDVPWGTCILAEQCDPEYRIYRGDYFCGRSTFVCCSLQITNYDMYQGLDQSFVDTSFSTDTDERRKRKMTSKERKRRRARKRRRRRIRDRNRRKRKMKKEIRKITREIKRLLNRKYSNTTRERKRKTRHMKSFIKDLKETFKNQKRHLKRLHSKELSEINDNFMTTLSDVKKVNKQFLHNDTFRDFILDNNLINNKAVDNILRTYPGFKKYLNRTRRSGALQNTFENSQEDSLDYDLEYGALYHGIK